MIWDDLGQLGSTQSPHLMEFSAHKDDVADPIVIMVK